MSSYLHNPQFLKQFFPQDQAGYDMVALAFYFSFHFPDGYRLECRRRTEEVCKDYWQLCGANLSWMITPMKCLWRPVPEHYAVESWFAGFPDKDWAWSMIFHSGQIQSEAASYQMVGLGNSTQTHDYSNLFLYVPATWFSENDNHDPIALYCRWSQMLKAHFGTAGLCLVPPEDTPKRGKTSTIAAAFGKKFPGVELTDSILCVNARSGLLSPNWLNMIDDKCIDELGGYETIKPKLATEPLGNMVGLHPYEGGLILSSGDYPQLCENNTPGAKPLAYGPVARLLKPLRTTEPWGSWGCPKDESLTWMSRFD